MSRTTRLLLVPAIAVFAALTLSACANPLQGLIEEGTGVTVDEGGDGATIETEDGSIDLGGSASVPDNFPSELPLPDAELLVAITGENSWTLTYTGMDAETADAFVDTFRDGDWEMVGDTADDNSAIASFENASYTLTFIWGDSGDGNYSFLYGAAGK
jgi:hypothetical protein